jgi:non-ribosomal peptide synthetase component F
MVTHHNVVRLFESTRERFGFSQQDVWTMFHSSAFDFSVWEMWGALLHGGRVVVVPYWVSRTPGEFYELVRREGVTVMSQTPSAFKQMMRVDEQEAGGELNLREVVFGGEALEMGSLRGWMERHGDRRPRLVNMYGITETTVHVTYREVREEDVKGGSVIGEGIGDMEVYLLGERMEAVPMMVEGEIYVGGGGVARGYLGRAELTAERFVPDGYGKERGGRLYRSGDIGRRLRSGEIEYVGRRDKQVKVRGYRIEVGEIESEIGEVEGVAEVVVKVVEVEGGEKRIVAYVVKRDGEEEEEMEVEIRRRVKERLPEYMVPSGIVMMDEMPMTRNGKVDRDALPAPDELKTRYQSRYIAPRTLIEELLAVIWREVLEIQHVSVQDNFFELGGHSLLATLVISRLREIFNIEVPVRELFDRPTVAGLAESLEIEIKTEQGLLTPPIMAIPRDGVLPLSFAQEHLWCLMRSGGGLSSQVTQAVLRFGGSLNVEALQWALNEIVMRHEILRAYFVEDGDHPLQLVHPSKEFAIQILNLSDLPEHEREARVLELARETAQSCDLARPSLLKATVVKFGDDEHVALLTMPCVISDRWSMGVLVKETAILYESYVKDGQSPLPDLPIQYADYAAWQKAWLSTEAFEQDTEGSNEQSMAETVSQPPAEETRQQGLAIKTASFVISWPVAQELRRLNQQEGATLSMVLLSAFKVLLHRYSGDDEIIIGATTPNRRIGETDELIGCFENTLVLRTDLSDNPTFRDLLERVRDVSIEAYNHREVPFGKVLEELKAEQDQPRAPIIHAMFALDDTPQQTVELPGVSVTLISLEAPIILADLNLFIEDGPDELKGSVVYNETLFDSEIISRMVESFNKLIEQVVVDVDQLVLDLPYAV